MKILTAFLLSALSLCAQPIVRSDFTTNVLSRTNPQFTNLTTRAASTTGFGLTVKGFSGQATNIVEVQSSTGDGLFKIGQNGGVGVGFMPTVGPGNILATNALYIGATSNVTVNTSGIINGGTWTNTGLATFTVGQYVTGGGTTNQGNMAVAGTINATNNIVARGGLIITAGGSTNVGLSTVQSLTATNGISIRAAGTLSMVSGTNQRAGNATLVDGTVTVANTTVTANSIVLYSRKTIGGTVGNMSYTLSAGVSFTINSSSATDTSVISYVLIEVP